MTDAPIHPNHRWTTFPKSYRSRKRLRSRAEGTLANIGRVVHTAEQGSGLSRPDVVGFHPPRLQGLVGGEDWHPYVPQLHGPLISRVHEQTPPPHCFHCGGPTELARRLSSHSHVEKVETRWVCINPGCLGHLDAVIYVYPIGVYERRC